LRITDEKSFITFTQAEDRPLMLNRAMFRQNGSSGYVLKPEVLRNQDQDGKKGRDKE
jgi:hypothetical protein